jgi:hypothetical protein
VVPLVRSLERRVCTLEDRATIIIIVHDEQWKVKLLAVRDSWRQSDSKRRDKLSEAKGGWDPATRTGAAAASAASAAPPAEPQLDAHPMGCSLRAAIVGTMVQLCCVAVAAECGENDPRRKLADEARKADGAQLDKLFFRGQPRHPKPMEGRPWVWAFLFAECASFDHRNVFFRLTELQLKQARFANAHSQDGPLCKQLSAWITKSRDNYGKAMETDEVEDEDDDEGKKKRTRGKRH